MPSLPQSGLLSLGASIPTNCHCRERSYPKKMLIYDDRSRNVYENKGKVDKMTVKISDIYGDMTWILQKNSGYDGPFTLNDTLWCGFCAIFATKISLPSRSRQRGYPAGAEGHWPRVQPVEPGADGCSITAGSNILPLLVRRFYLRLMILFPFGELRGL